MKEKFDVASFLAGVAGAFFGLAILDLMFAAGNVWLGSTSVGISFLVFAMLNIIHDQKKDREFAARQEAESINAKDDIVEETAVVFDQEKFVS